MFDGNWGNGGKQKALQAHFFYFLISCIVFHSMFDVECSMFDVHSFGIRLRSSSYGVTCACTTEEDVEAGTPPSDLQPRTVMLQRKIKEKEKSPSGTFLYFLIVFHSMLNVRCSFFRDPPSLFELWRDMCPYYRGRCGGGDASERLTTEDGYVTEEDKGKRKKPFRHISSFLDCFPFDVRCSFFRDPPSLFELWRDMCPYYRGRVRQRSINR